MSRDVLIVARAGLKYWGFATDDDFEGEQDKPYWYVKKPGALAVETTAYALLTQLTLNDVTASNPIVSWLLQQREEHGSFVSTQVGWPGDVYRFLSNYLHFLVFLLNIN